MTKKRVLFIGVGAFQTLALKQLNRKGYYIIGVDGSDDASGKTLCDEFHAISFENEQDILKLGIDKQASFAMSVECDPAVTIVNEFNRKNGNNFISEIACQASMSKVIIREIQKSLKLSHPKFYHVYSLLALQKYIKKNASKIQQWVLKPTSSSGSRGVVFIDVLSNLPECYEQSMCYANYQGEGLILEEFIAGQEIAIDGFVHLGKLHTLSLSFKDRTPAPFMLDEGLFISSDLSSDLYEQCKTQLSTIFTHLSSDLSAPFHVEMITGKNKLFIVEFSFRGAGFNVFSKWIPNITGVDTIAKQIEQIVSVNKEIDFLISKQKNLYVGFLSGNKGVLKSVHGVKSILAMPEIVEFTLYVQIGDKINDLKSGADRVGHVVLRGHSHGQLKTIFDSIVSLLELTYE